MPPPRDKPTLLLLRTRIPDPNPTRWLGRFVTHMHRPLDEVVPGLTTHWKGQLLPQSEFYPTVTTETDANYLISSARANELKTSLIQALGFSSESSEKTSIEGIVRKYPLYQHKEAFTRLQQNQELWKEVEVLLARSGALSNLKLYMVVGVATIEKGRITTTKQGEKGLTGTLSFPVPGTGNLNINAVMGAGRTRTMVMSSAITVTDQEIFAFEYRVVKRPIARMRSPPAIGNAPRFKWGDQVFSKPIPAAANNLPLGGVTGDMELVEQSITTVDVESAVLHDDEEGADIEWTSGQIEGISGFDNIIYAFE